MWRCRLFQRLLDSLIFGTFKSNPEHSFLHSLRTPLNAVSSTETLRQNFIRTVYLIILLRHKQQNIYYSPIHSYQFSEEINVATSTVSLRLAVLPPSVCLFRPSAETLPSKRRISEALQELAFSSSALKSQFCNATDFPTELACPLQIC